MVIIDITNIKTIPKEILKNITKEREIVKKEHEEFFNYKKIEIGDIKTLPKRGKIKIINYGTDI